MKRPLAVAGFSMMFAIIIASYLSIEVAVIVGVLLVLFAAVGFSIKSLPGSVPTCVLFFAVGMLICGCYMGLKYSPLEIYDGQECSVEGVIAEEPTVSYDNVRYIVRVSSVNGEEVDFNVRVTTDGVFHPDADRYDRISFTSVLNIPENTEGSAFNTKNFFLSENIAFTTYVDSVNIVIKDALERPMTAFFSDIRSAFKSVLETMLCEKSGVAVAVMLGDTSLLTQQQRDNFSMIGVSHLFAVSGLHLSVLLAIFMWIARKARVHRVLTLVLGIIVIFMFMGITGFSSSVIRAGVMSILTLIGMLIFREADPLNSLGAAITILIIISPLSPLGIGFQMSVLATAGLLIIAPRMAPSVFGRVRKTEQVEETRETNKDLDGDGDIISDESDRKAPITKQLKNLGRKLLFFVIGSIVTSVSANIFLLPIYSYNFGAISVLMPLANLLLVPAGSAVLILSLLTSSLYCIPVIGRWLVVIPAFADKLVIRYIDFVSDGMSAWEWQRFGLAGTYLRVVIIFVILAVLLWLCKKTTHVFGVTAAVCCSVVFLTGVVTDAVFCRDLTKIYLWGNSNASCAVINTDGSSLTYCADGYRGEIIAEQYRCVDGCFDETEISFDTPSLSDDFSLNGWIVKTLPGKTSAPALILQNREISILLLNSPDETVAQAVLDEDIFFDIIYFRETENCATHLLTDGRIGETVVLCEGYGAIPQTKIKLLAKSYSVIDISDTDGTVLTLSSAGKYSLST